MSNYKAPLRDLQFALFEVLGYGRHYQLLQAEDATPDVIQAIIEEAARFAEQVVAPLNATGDAEGCRWHDGEVTTPAGFKEAYAQWVEAGWPQLPHPVEHGGQGLPESLAMVLMELFGTANWSWNMYSGLSHGAIKTLEMHGDASQKNHFLKPLIAGRWSGTMCLTEAHCGTDLGLLKTRAQAADDGSFRITGSKIFISSGEHDLTENIVHIVLARLPDAPAGTKGISLFIVPKFRVAEDGSLAERNQVVCGGLEEKMGIHGNATCTLHFDGAQGYLIGPPNRGLNCMFTFMNSARLGSAIQGLVHAEAGFQQSLRYSRDRLQMRSLSGPKNPAGPADPIIVHPDIRRMLLTQKAFAEGGRMFIYYCASLADLEFRSPDAHQRQEASNRLALLTPIAKAFLTETGIESASMAVQCFGGHGYIRESGVEQNLRDARISTIYEGTTGVQALDLLGRKILGSQDQLLESFTGVIDTWCNANAEAEALGEFLEPLARAKREWQSLTQHIAVMAQADPEEVGAAAVEYLMYSGYVVLAYFWAQAAQTATEALARENSDGAFYQAKLDTARFYFQRVLPRTKTLDATIRAGAGSLMAMPEDSFRF